MLWLCEGVGLVLCVNLWVSDWLRDCLLGGERAELCENVCCIAHSLISDVWTLRVCLCCYNACLVWSEWVCGVFCGGVRDACGDVICTFHTFYSCCLSQELIRFCDSILLFSLFLLLASRLNMPHSFGYRAQTRTLFKKEFKTKGHCNTTTYLRTFKVCYV